MRPFRAEKIPRPRCLPADKTGIGFVLPPGIEHLDIEIGSGVGQFAIEYARYNPNRFLIALEHTRTRFGTFFRTYQEIKTHSPQALNNLLPVHANAIGWITHALAPRSVDRYFILYPNPEPKNAARRWANMPFFSRILQTLKPGGTVELATNLEHYFREAEERFRETWNLTVTLKECWEKSTHLSHARTPFERKYLERNQRCYRLVGTKSSGFEAPF